MSAVYRLNSNGPPSTKPCGTPYNNRCILDSVPLYVTCCVRLVRNDVSHCRSSKMITGHIKTLSCKTLFTAAVQALKKQAEKTTLFLFPLSPIFFIAPPPTHLLYIPTLPNMPPTIPHYLFTLTGVWGYHIISIFENLLALCAY